MEAIWMREACFVLVLFWFCSGFVLGLFWFCSDFVLILLMLWRLMS